LRAAILEAGRVRLRPIIMTTVTTVLGLTPMALGIGRGADLRAPLAIAVIGGLISATALTLVVVPVAYDLFEAMRGRLRGLVGAKTAVAMLLGAVLLGCGDGGETGGSIVRDSAGIRVVENRAPMPGTLSWQVSPTPRVEIGTLQGDDVYQLFQVGGVVSLTDGTIVVANGGTHELRFYDREGRFLRSAGREGEGPGEFRGVGRVAQVGDSIVAYDWGLSRISVFDSSGQHVRSARVKWQSEGSAEALGVFGDGRWLFSTGFSFVPSEVSKVVRDTSDYVILSREGEFEHWIGRFPRVEFFVMSTAQQGRASSRVFGRTTFHAVSERHAYIGATDRYEIFRYTSEGELDQIVRKEHEPLAVTDEDVAERKRERLEEASSNWRPTLERMYLDMPIPTTMPAFAGLCVDASGNLWVLEYARPSDDRRRWTVFVPDGRALGTIDTPPRLQVHQIGDDFVLGTSRDELGVEHVQVYELTK
jgi:hypothetical protein